MKFFYRVKIPVLADDCYFGQEWNYKAFDIGYIEADSKSDAKKLIEQDYNEKMCQRSKSDDIGIKNKYLVQIYEPNDYFDKIWNYEHTCEVCGQLYTKLQRDTAHDFKYIRGEVCSELCEERQSKIKSVSFSENFDFNGIHQAVIYRIYNKNDIEQKSYIGKTTQAFTLRWYQHFFQTKNTKFHNAIRETNITDWSFEVIESFNFSGKDIGYNDEKGYAKLLSEREQFWINQYDSLNNGYNSVSAKSNYLSIEEN